MATASKTFDVSLAQWRDKSIFFAAFALGLGGTFGLKYFEIDPLLVIFYPATTAGAGATDAALFMMTLSICMSPAAVEFRLMETSHHPFFGEVKGSPSPVPVFPADGTATKRAGYMHPNVM